MDDADETDVSEDGEITETEGADDGMSDIESPNPNETGKYGENTTSKGNYHIFETKFDEVILAKMTSSNFVSKIW